MSHANNREHWWPKVAFKVRSEFSSTFHECNGIFTENIFSHKLYRITAPSEPCITLTDLYNAHMTRPQSVLLWLASRTPAQLQCTVETSRQYIHVVEATLLTQWRKCTMNVNCEYTAYSALCWLLFFVILPYKVKVLLQSYTNICNHQVGGIPRCICSQ